MQTFLPYPDLALSAKVLDYRRLGGQINEVQIMLDTLHELNKGTYWNHPIVNAWRHHEAYLCEFGLTCLDEWRSRKYALRQKNEDKLRYHLDLCMDGGTELTPPDWFGQEWVHEQYKGLLVWKNPGFYTRLFPGITAVSPQDFKYPVQTHGPSF